MFRFILATKLDNICTEFESFAKYLYIMGDEIDSAKLVRFFYVKKTLFLDFIELITTYSKKIISSIFLEDAKCLL